MDIKNIIVKEYLESLTEKNELNYIFPILLESMGFVVLSKPTEYLGIQEFGKDIVAVGIDEDGIKKRFYFELKGGADRNITEKNFLADDGIHNSIIHATYKKFISAFPQFDNLPLKIVIVHNGEVKGTVQETLEEFFKTMRQNIVGIEFERWGISQLTLLFSEKLFGAYLLTDPRTTKLFNRVLVNLNVTDGVSADYIQLLEVLLSKHKWKHTKTLPRKWMLLFESLKLVGFVVYTESKEYNNLEIAKRYMTHLVIKFWHWILKNNLENDKLIRPYFHQVMILFLKILREYFERTMPIATLKDGLYSEKSGRYEQIGYNKRAFEYLEYFTFYANISKYVKPENNIDMVQHIVTLVNNNRVLFNPILDIHSLPIVNILNAFIESGKIESAKTCVIETFRSIMFSKEKLNMLPDANNNVKNVIKYVVTGMKPVYYSDSTSPLLTVLLEYTAILDMEDEYLAVRDFVKEHDIELGVFVPHHGKNSTSRNLILDKESDLEEQLFSRSVNDGYQSGLRLNENFNKELGFEDFKEKIKSSVSEFEYEYRTDKAGYPFLRELAHSYFMTPFFPDRWRNLIPNTNDTV